jgi:hypothetical protein
VFPRRPHSRAAAEVKTWIASYLAFARGTVETVLETPSPRERPVFVRKRTRRTVRVEERKAHGLTCGLLDGAGALEVVEG